MLKEIKKRVEKEIGRYALYMDRTYSLSNASPVLFSHIRDFILRRGKRIRPLLFIIGYLGFSKKPAPGLYASAISMELMHDFVLVHDDIIDKSATRRDGLSMHSMLNRYLKKYKNIKFSGEDLAIVLGDMLYAAGIGGFLGISGDAKLKEKALRQLTGTAVHTGAGEFLELISGTRDMDGLSAEDIYAIYDLKTARYSFATPLSIGAMLGGAKKEEVDVLFKYGMYLGRAFQIQDDILDMFGGNEGSGKPDPADLREAKKTILVWYAYNNSNKKNKAAIKRILGRKSIRHSDMLRMRRIIRDSGALDYAKKQVRGLVRKAENLDIGPRMSRVYKNLLADYSDEIITA